MDNELGNLRGALRWLIGEANAGPAQRLAGAARTLWLQRAYLAEGRRWIDEALALDAAAGPPKDPAARARALLGLIAVAVHQADLLVAEHAGVPRCTCSRSCLATCSRHGVLLVRQPAVARAVRCVPLLDQLELTLELLRLSAWPDFGAVEELPPNVIRFRPRLR